MNIISRPVDGAMVISVSGSVDALTAGEVAGYLHDLAGSQPANLVVDLGQVDFMSSAGLRALLMALKESRQVGGDLRLAAAQTGVERVLTMSGFTEILRVFPTVEEAVASFMK